MSFGLEIIALVFASISHSLAMVSITVLRPPASLLTVSIVMKLCQGPDFKQLLLEVDEDMAF